MKKTVNSKVTIYYAPKVEEPKPDTYPEMIPHTPTSHSCPVKNPRSIVRVKRRDGCEYEAPAYNVGWGPKGYGRHFLRPEYEIVAYKETGRVALAMYSTPPTNRQDEFDDLGINYG